MSEPYDLNFCYPVHILENARVKLTPFIPSVHGEAFFAATAPHPEMYDYIPFAPFPTLPAFLNWVETRIRCDPTLVLFAVLDKSKTSDAYPSEESPQASLAGIIGLLDTSPDHLRTEIGLLFTLPTYWRTHITANAVGLLLSWCFDELGMRRVQWRSDPMNVASIRVAERMGFQRERVKRWDRVLAPGKEGVGVRADDVMPKGKGLHTMYLAICWDDWGEWRERVLEVMNRNLKSGPSSNTERSMS